MNKKAKKICIVMCVLLAACCIIRPLWYVDLSGAYDAKLVYKYEDIDKSCHVDWDDQIALTHILKGVKFRDTPSCSFDTDVSITFTVGDDQREIMLCPACDGCPVFQVGKGDYYIKIDDEERRQFDKIVEKYGMVFPCI